MSKRSSYIRFRANIAVHVPSLIETGPKERRVLAQNRTLQVQYVVRSQSDLHVAICEFGKGVGSTVRVCLHLS